MITGEFPMTSPFESMTFRRELWSVSSRASLPRPHLISEKHLVVTGNGKPTRTLAVRQVPFWRFSHPIHQAPIHGPMASEAFNYLRTEVYARFFQMAPAGRKGGESWRNWTTYINPPSRKRRLEATWSNQKRKNNLKSRQSGIHCCRLL